MVPETPAPHNEVVAGAGQYWRIHFHEGQTEYLAVRPIRGTMSTAQAEICLRHLCGVDIWREAAITGHHDHDTPLQTVPVARYSARGTNIRSPTRVEVLL